MLIQYSFSICIPLILLASANVSGRSLMLRNSDANAQLPTSSTYDPQEVQRLPRVKLLYNKQNQNRVAISTDNRFVNNSARNNYEQFLSK